MAKGIAIKISTNQHRWVALSCLICIVLLKLSDLVVTPNLGTRQTRKETYLLAEEDRRAEPTEVAAEELSDELDPLTLSVKQQTKFNQRSPLLDKYFERAERYDLSASKYAAIVLTNEYAFLHIFKNGGTTVKRQTDQKELRLTDPSIQKRRWLTVVRDPLDHFLSGWAECGERWKKNELLAKKKTTKGAKKRRKKKVNLTISYQPTTMSYDVRIASWLQACKHHVNASTWIREEKRVAVQFACETHSLPQTSFMLVNGKVAQQLQVVGDLRELPAVLENVGVKFNYNKATGRNATASGIKVNNFPRRIDLLSNATIREVCKFVAIDYFMFDFEPPEACRDLPILQRWKNI